MNVFSREDKNGLENSCKDMLHPENKNELQVSRTYKFVQEFSYHTKPFKQNK